MNTLKNKALDLLARREHTRFELAIKLKKRGFDSDDIYPVLDELKEADFLSEERFIGSFIRTRCYKGYGPLKIVAQLLQRGIKKNQILTHEEWHSVSWQERADAVRMKRFGETFPHNSQERLRQARFLQLRGFTEDQIHDALKKK